MEYQAVSPVVANGIKIENTAMDVVVVPSKRSSSAWAHLHKPLMISQNGGDVFIEDISHVVGQRISISLRIASAQRIPSAIAQTVAGTSFPPSY